ncbi:MAG: hypothetical protein ACI9VR_001312 [Cognaticolwellia sp.]|jgi:hypothetical protein
MYMTTQRRLILFFLYLPALAACNPDIATDLIGVYQGELVANDTMDLAGEVSVAVVDNNHVEIWGQDSAPSTWR